MADAAAHVPKLKPRDEVGRIGDAYAGYLLGKMDDAQRASYSEKQIEELRWAIEMGYRNGYEAAVEDQTGVHRPSLEREQKGFESEVRALHVSAKVHAGGKDPTDNLRRAIGRRNEDLARLTDGNQVVAWLFRDMGVAILKICQRRSWDPRHAKTTAIITPEDKIVVTVRSGGGDPF